MSGAAAAMAFSSAATAACSPAACGARRRSAAPDSASAAATRRRLSGESGAVSVTGARRLAVDVGAFIERQPALVLFPRGNIYRLIRGRRELLPVRFGELVGVPH